MAKTGFPYYRAETDRFQDIRIKKLKRHFKCEGYCIFEYIVNEIFKSDCCYISLNDTLISDVSGYWEIDKGLVDNVISYCCDINLFDKLLFVKFGILTSFEIQSSWIKQAMFIDFDTLPPQYLLIDRSSIPFYKSNKNSRLGDRNIKLWKKISEEVLKRDDYTCFYCGKRGGILEIDHILPVSKGGNDDLSNLVTACRKCNRQKKDKMINEFIEWRIRHGYSKHGT